MERVSNPDAATPALWPRFDRLSPPLVEEAEAQERRRLLRQARAGSAGALCLLWERYRLRLPLVEQRISVAFPRMRAFLGGRRPPRESDPPAQSTPRQAAHIGKEVRK